MTTRQVTRSAHWTDRPRWGYVLTLLFAVGAYAASLQRSIAALEKADENRTKFIERATDQRNRELDSLVRRIERVEDRLNH